MMNQTQTTKFKELAFQVMYNEDVFKAYEEAIDEASAIDIQFRIQGIKETLENIAKTFFYTQPELQKFLDDIKKPELYLQYAKDTGIEDKMYEEHSKYLIPDATLYTSAIELEEEVVTKDAVLSEYKALYEDMNKASKIDMTRFAELKLVEKNSPLATDMTYTNAVLGSDDIFYELNFGQEVTLDNCPAVMEIISDLDKEATMEYDASVEINTETNKSVSLSQVYGTIDGVDVYLPVAFEEGEQFYPHEELKNYFDDMEVKITVSGTYNEEPSDEYGLDYDEYEKTATLEGENAKKALLESYFDTTRDAINGLVSKTIASYDGGGNFVKVEGSREETQELSQEETPSAPTFSNNFEVEEIDSYEK